MIELSYKTNDYALDYDVEEDAVTNLSLLRFRDYIKIDAPNKGRIYTAYLAFVKKDRKLWAMSDPTDIPANRYLAVNTFVTLAQIEATTEDLKGAFERIAKMLTEGNAALALGLAQKCNSIIQITDPLQKWLNLASAFLFFDNENPMFYDQKTAKEKLSLLNSLSPSDKKTIAEWSRDYFDKLITGLMRTAPECFVETGDRRDFFNVIEDLTVQENQMADLLRQLSEKSAVNRDWVLSYPISELYRDMGTLVRHSEQIKEHYEKK